MLRGMSQPRHRKSGPKGSAGGDAGRPPHAARPQGRPQPAAVRPNKSEARREVGWDPVAAWYDKLVGETGSDYHRQLIIPAAMRLLDIRSGESVADVCCGQGVLVGRLLDAGAARVLGVDASPRLIDAAGGRHGRDPRVRLLVADACGPAAWADASHDAAACLMAVHDVADIGRLFSNIAGCLKPGGRAVVVMMHPCFRIPRQSHWGWDADQKIQFRRLDCYATPQAIAITTHPGKATGEHTEFHHRPLADVIAAMGAAGLAITACEEPCSHRRSQAGGPFSKAEHRAAQEFPLFIALGAVRLPVT